MTVLEERVILGTGSWGRLRSCERLQLMQQAWSLGLRSIDTAPSYGFGGVEPDVFRWWPGSIDTKVGLQPTSLQRKIATVYPLLWRAASIRSRNSPAPAAAAPNSDLGPATIASAVDRLCAVDDNRFGVIWIHDAASTKVGEEALTTVSMALGLDADRCGLAWTTLPPHVPSHVPLLLPYQTDTGWTGSDRAVHWHGVVRYFAARATRSTLDELAYFLAGVLRKLPDRHRVVIGAYRPEHLDVLHRVASLHASAELDPELAAQLDQTSPSTPELEQ